MELDREVDQMNSIYIWSDFAAYAGPTFGTSRHSHFFHQLCIGIDGPIRLRGKDGSWYSYNIAYIPSGTSHETEQTDARFMILLLDPLVFGVKLFSNLKIEVGKPAISLNGLFTQIDILEYFNVLNNDGAAFRKQFLAEFIDKGIGNTKIETDSRILETIERLYSTSDNLSLATLAENTNISPSRFRHLFIEQTGIPLSAYKLWLKTRKAILYLGERPDLIHAAYEGGFSDQAHFSRIFRRSFGLNPSELQKSRDFKVNILKG
jgi:AraC-like DNA-binding protein